MKGLARRALHHPGPAAAQRVVAVPVRLSPVHGELQPGRTVLAEVARVLGEAGAESGVLTFGAGRCRPYRYVLPAWSADGVHAAWYSDVFDPPGGADIAEAVAIVGREAGELFLHVHGRWHAGDGLPEAGHMLAAESVVETAIPVSGLVAHGGRFERLPDEETAFALFTPVAGERADGSNGLLLRVLPGEDVSHAVERACAAAGIRSARVHGIGSVDGVRFAEGRHMDCAATEIFLRDGRVDQGHASLPAVVVDVAGSVGDGVLERGDNPVGVTFELVIEDLGDGE